MIKNHSVESTFIYNFDELLMEIPPAPQCLWVLLDTQDYTQDMYLKTDERTANSISLSQVHKTP